MKYKSLQISQLNGKIKSLDKLRQVALPPIGWIKAIRMALGMSAQQLGNKLSITRQGVQDMERREREGAITLNALREAAQALDMQLVYGFVPNDGSLEALINKKAKELATQVVMRTSQNMRLEDQENSRQRIEQAIEERMEAIKREMPKALWD